MPNAMDRKLVIWNPSLRSIWILFTINKNGTMNIKTINVVINILEYSDAILDVPKYFIDQVNNANSRTNRNTAFRKRLESLKKEYKNIASDAITINSGERI